MIPQAETFYIKQTTKDRFGKIISTQSPVVFYGISDESTVYDNGNGTLNVLGTGTVFTDTELDFLEGQEIQVGGDWYIIKKKFRAKVLGAFHHWELVYG